MGEEAARGLLHRATRGGHSIPTPGSPTQIHREPHSPSDPMLLGKLILVPCAACSRRSSEGDRRFSGFLDGARLVPNGAKACPRKETGFPSHSVGCFPDFNAWGAWGNGWQSWGNRLRIWGNAWGAWGNRVASLGQRVAPRVSRVGSRGRVVAPRGFLESGHVFGVGKHGATLGILVPGAGRSHASRGTHLPSTRTVHPTRGTRVAAAWHPCPGRWRG